MAMVHIMCGKICSGKSTLAKKLCDECKGVILSVDEITLSLFGAHPGESHDEYVLKCEKFLYKKSLEIMNQGINVILDWGFWTKKERDEAKWFYRNNNVMYKFYYLDISDTEWKKRIKKRNKDILEKGYEAYFVDEGLAQKFQRIFEIPNFDEIDEWITVKKY